MEPTTFIVVFAATFVNVFMLGIQTKVVMASRVIPAFIISLCISASLYVVINAATAGSLTWYMLSSGVGGALGVSASIVAHDKIEAYLDKRLNNEN